MEGENRLRGEPERNEIDLGGSLFGGEKGSSPERAETRLQRLGEGAFARVEPGLCRTRHPKSDPKHRSAVLGCRYDVTIRLITYASSEPDVRVGPLLGYAYWQS